MQFHSIRGLINKKGIILQCKLRWRNMQVVYPLTTPECNGSVNKSVINKRAFSRNSRPYQEERHTAISETQIAGYSKSVPSNSQGTSDYPRPQQGNRPDAIEDNSTSWYSSEAGKPYAVPVIQSAKNIGYNHQLQTFQYEGQPLFRSEQKGDPVQPGQSFFLYQIQPQQIYR